MLHYNPNVTIYIPSSFKGLKISSKIFSISKKPYKLEKGIYTTIEAKKPPIWYFQWVWFFFDCKDFFCFQYFIANYWHASYTWPLLYTDFPQEWVIHPRMQLVQILHRHSVCLTLFCKTSILVYKRDG